MRARQGRHELMDYLDKNHPELRYWTQEDRDKSSKLYKGFSLLFGKAKEMPPSAME